MAQSTGTVSGQVTDPTGAVLPGATVTLTDTHTRTSRTATTNEAGRYVFVAVPPGNYDLTYDSKGFVKGKVTGQRVGVGDTTTLNMALKVGGQTEMITVEATGAQLQTTNATVGTSMSFDMAQALPGLARDISALAMLQPATAPSGTQAAGGQGAVAGSNADQNAFTLDGGYNNNDMDGVGTVYLTSFASNPLTGSGGAVPNGVVPTPIDSIEEFKVGVVGHTADFNQAAGNSVAVATRRGGSTWHGTAYDYYYPSNTAANSWANNKTPSTDPKTGALLSYTPNPKRHYNKFGFSAGGPILPKFLGGKTYLFGFYQGFRFTNGDIIEKPVPSDLLRLGVIQVQSTAAGCARPGVVCSTDNWVAYNLSNSPVVYKGVTYPVASNCGSGGNLPCDPRGVGLNPIVNQIWSQWMPKGNDPSGGDQHNTIGYSGAIGLPQKDNNLVFRLDHDFGSRNKFFMSYRYYKTAVPSNYNLTNAQMDIGGLLGGGKLGTYNVLRSVPSLPSIMVAGLTSQITSNLTNDFHWSYTRNWWAWNTLGAPPQPINGLGGAVEIGGETENALIPYNVNTQSVRTRVWDGKDSMFRDDLNWLHGNHLIAFGGLFQRNHDFHDRNDNGQGIMAWNVYQVANTGGGINWSGAGSILPPTSVVSTSQQGNFESWYTQVLGIVGQPQSLYTRAGADLHLLPLGTHANDDSKIDYYQGYVSDTWKFKPTITLTYGLSYALELPPVEKDGKQVMLVDSGGNPIVFQDYMQQRVNAALKGQVYNPVIGFATSPNVGKGRKYPYDTFWGGISPRASVAWNPRFSGGLMGKLLGDGNTVIRGGYARIYGRLNGVDLVLVPLLGTGLMQAVQCTGAVASQFAVGGNQCLGPNGAVPGTAFRIGTDGLVAPLGGAPSTTLAQPYFPGTPIGNPTGAINLKAASGSVLDPKFRPNSNDTFNLSIQREVSKSLFVEVGYIGKLIHNEFQEIATEGVPYMTTLGGQTFAAAYAGMFNQLCGSLSVQSCVSNVPAVTTAQPFFEAALGGPTSAYCTGFANCTAAVAAKQTTNIAGNLVYTLWQNLASATSWTLGNTMYTTNPPGGCPSSVTINTVCAQSDSIQWNTSIGYGNYHAVYGSFTFRDFHGVTARSNFTWGRALGTGSEVQARSTRTAFDPFNIRNNYGVQTFDVKFVYNLALNYKPPYFKDQRGIVGHVLGGWSIAPLFTAQSGLPLACSATTQALGAAVNANAVYSCPLTNGKFTGGNQLHYFTSAPNATYGSNPTATFNGASQWLNMFADPAAAYTQFRRAILGQDNRSGGFGTIRGFNRWNLDLTIAKEIRATERVHMTLTMQMANVFNHMQPSDPSLSLTSQSTFGRVNGTAYDSRQIEFGAHVKW